MSHLARHRAEYSALLREATKLVKESESIYMILPVLGFVIGLGLHYLLKKKTKRQKKFVLDINCSICYADQRQILFDPCKHIAVCAGCAQKVYSCPMCRTRIQNKIYIEHYINFEN